MSVNAPAVRIMAGGRKFSVALIWGVVLIAACAFAASTYAMVALAAEFGLHPALRFTVPVVIDGGIVIFASSTAGFHAQDRRAPWLTYATDAALVLLSVWINVWHAQQFTDLLLAQVVAGALPVVLFVCIHTVRSYSFDTRKVRVARAAKGAASPTKSVPTPVAPDPTAPAAAVSQKLDGPVAASAPRPPAASTHPGSTRARVLELHEEGKTNAEIAKIVGIDRSGVSRHLSKAKAEQRELVAV